MNQMPLNYQFGLLSMISYRGVDQLRAKLKMPLSLLKNLLIMMSSLSEITPTKVRKKTLSKIKGFTKTESCLSLKLEVPEPNLRTYKKKCLKL
jgi:hypothetical protein